MKKEVEKQGDISQKVIFPKFAILRNLIGKRAPQQQPEVNINWSG